METKMKKTENTSFIKNSPKDNLRSIAIIVCAIITGVSGFFSFFIEGSVFPFVFQNLFCLMFAGIIGGISGAAVSGITLMLGALGLPFFSYGTGGAICLSGETGGFLIGYFIASLFIGIFLGKPSTEKASFIKIIFSMFIGFSIIYLVGFFQYFKVTKIGFSFLTLENLFYQTIPFFVGDFIKLIIASIATYFLRPVSAKYFYEEIRNN
jgi:biotin transport system substrate-specific component